MSSYSRGGRHGGAASSSPPSGRPSVTVTRTDPDVQLLSMDIHAGGHTSPPARTSRTPLQRDHDEAGDDDGEPFGLDHPDLSHIRWYLVAFGVWRPRNNMRFLPLQLLVFCAITSFLVLFFVALEPAGEAALNRHFAQQFAFPTRFSSHPTLFVPAVLLNALPVACFVGTFLALNAHLSRSLAFRASDRASRALGVDRTIHISRLLAEVPRLRFLAASDKHRKLEEVHGAATSTNWLSVMTRRRTSTHSAGGKDRSTATGYDSLLGGSGDADKAVGAHARTGARESVVVAPPGSLSRAAVGRLFRRRVVTPISVHLLLLHIAASGGCALYENAATGVPFFHGFLYWVWVVVWFAPPLALMMLYSLCAHVHILQLEDLAMRVRHDPLGTPLRAVAARAKHISRQADTTSGMFQGPMIASLLLPAFAAVSVGFEVMTTRTDVMDQLQLSHYLWMFVMIVMALAAGFYGFSTAAGVSKRAQTLIRTVVERHVELHVQGGSAREASVYDAFAMADVEAAQDVTDALAPSGTVFVDMGRRSASAAPGRGDIVGGGGTDTGRAVYTTDSGATANPHASSAGGARAGAGPGSAGAAAVASRAEASNELLAIVKHLEVENIGLSFAFTSARINVNWVRQVLLLFVTAAVVIVQRVYEAHTK